MEARKLDRDARTIHIGEQTQGYEAATTRHTGKTLQEWEEEFRRRLVSDIEHGRLNPDKWFLLHQLNGLATRYGFASPDDIVVSMVPIKVLLTFHSIKTPVDGANGEAKTMLAARLNPEKYGHLASLYRTKSMQRIV